MIDFIDPETNLAKLFERAYAARPDLAAAEEDLEASKRERDAARSWVYPNIFASGTAGGFGKDPSSFKDQGTVLAGLEWRFGAAISGHLHRAEAGLQEAELRGDLLRRHMTAQVSSAVESALALRVAIAAAEREEAASVEGLKLAQARFQQGDALLLEVVELQATLMRARSHRARSVLQYNRSQFDLLHAVGGPEE